MLHQFIRIQTHFTSSITSGCLIDGLAVSMTDVSPWQRYGELGDYHPRLVPVGTTPPVMGKWRTGWVKRLHYSLRHWYSLLDFLHLQQS
ncbi:MAG: hypothetical protein F6K42_34500 [Leptolyngbya sp. SIO1D8]|nr:hypothetical protein [Leptolyngbya sp. SIO1D8]